MVNSVTTLAMRAHIEVEIPRLFSAATFQSQPMDDAAIYEAYIHTCVVEAVELLQSQYPLASIRWELVSPPNAPDQLVLRKKACSIASATANYGYIRIWVGTNEYELHTDVPVRGESGVLNELDVAVLKASACQKIRATKKAQKKQPTPYLEDVVLLIEAKCYGSVLKLSIGRAFLGLHNTEFKGRPVGCLVSTATNESVGTMLNHHGKQQQQFWPMLDDAPATRQEFVNDLAGRLAQAIVVPRNTVRPRLPRSRHLGIVQLRLPSFR